MEFYPGVTPVTELRADAILLGAGAWDAAPTEMQCVGSNPITLYLGYIRGGAAGAVDLLVEVSPYSTDAGALGTVVWAYRGVEQVGAFAAGADTVSGLQRLGPITYTATGAGQENVVYSLEVEHTVERIRVSARESGNVGAPGTCEIIAFQDAG